MKNYSILTFLLLISLPSIAQYELHRVTGNVINVTKANYNEEDKFLIYVDAATGYTVYTKLWSVTKLVMEDRSELTYEEYDKTFDIKNHKHGDVFVTYVEPTNKELTTITESSKEFMNISEGSAIEQMRKLAYQQGGNILYVQIDQKDNSGRFSIYYRIYSTLQFHPELFDTYNGTFSIEGFNDGIRLDDWASNFYPARHIRKIDFQG